MMAPPLFIKLMLFRNELEIEQSIKINQPVHHCGLSSEHFHFGYEITLLQVLQNSIQNFTIKLGTFGDFLSCQSRFMSVKKCHNIDIVFCMTEQGRIKLVELFCLAIKTGFIRGDFYCKDTVFPFFIIKTMPKNDLIANKNACLGHFSASF